MTNHQPTLTYILLGLVLRFLTVIIMDDQPHKAHRPAQSGAKKEKKINSKGREKEYHFNEKVCIDEWVTSV
jgi:hypothetical protein